MSQLKEYSKSSGIFSMKYCWRNIFITTIFAWLVFLFSIVMNFTFSYMGVTDKQITILIVKNFVRFLIVYNLKIFLFYTLIGLFIGFLACLLKIGRKRGAILFSFFYWGFFWVRAIKMYPQLFLSQLYNQVWILKYFQVALTDFIPFLLIYGLVFLIIVIIGLRNKSYLGTVAVILLTLLIIVRIDTFPRKAKTITAPNVLIFATDSLRPQNISYHGYFRKTSEIDQVLKKGVTFLNAKASVARTFPLWTSILTSLFSPDHGIRTMYPSQKELGKKWVTLIDILNKENYFTSVVSDFAGDMFSRIDYGFQRVHVPKFVIKSLIKQRCLEIHYFLMGYLVNPIGVALFPELSGLPMFLDPYFVTERTKQEIRRSISQNKPFFIIAFSSNTHFPYVSPYPYYQYYGGRGYYRKHKYCLGSDMLRSFLGERLEKIDQQQILNLYDNTIRIYDDQVGEITKFLKNCNIEKNTILVVMSDHGENLLEADLGSGHGDHLRGSFANNMFLGIQSPFESFQGRKINETVRDIDLAPTLLDMLKIPVPLTFKGESLLPYMRGKEFFGLPAYLETGLWYTRWAPFIPNRIRLDYPMIKDMLTLNLRTGEIILKKEFSKIVINAKYRGLQWNDKKYIYMPGANSYQEEFYIGDKLQKKDNIQDSDFLIYKKKIVDMFKDKFYLDSKGFIREK